MDFQNDLILLEQLKDGHTAAFEFVVQDYSKDLLLQATSLTNDCAIAQDIVQDVLLDLWTKRTNINIQTSLKNYLFGMIRHRFLRMISRNKLHQDAIQHISLHTTKLESNVLEMIQMSEILNTVQEAVKFLPENMRYIYELRNDDLSLREIAEVLGLAEQTVKSYHAELNNRIKSSVLKNHPDIGLGVLGTLVYLLTKS